MPVEARPDDQFSRVNLLLGFPVVEFTPRLADGSLGAVVPMGIIEGFSLQKVVENLELERGDSGLLTVDREIISKFKPSFQISTFNLRSDVARLILGSDVATAVVADPAAQITNEALQVPTGADAARTFIDLARADVDETPANLTLTCATITGETVENVTGDGTTLGDYKLAFKPFILGDVTSLQEVDSSGAVVRTFTVQAGAPAGATEAQLTVGTGTGSGELEFFQAVGAGNSIIATYTPSHALEEDEAAANNDMILDPLLGRIRFPYLTVAGAALRPGQNVELDYQYVRRASTTLQPFRQGGLAFEGVASVKQLTDIGVNFTWSVPSVTLLLTDDDLTFGAENFATGTLRMNLNDAGGSTRYGTIAWSSETEANA